MSWKKRYLYIWISRESSKAILVKVFRFKSMRMNEITKEIRVTGEKKRHGTEPQDTPPLKWKQMERSQQQSLAVALWLVRMKTTVREWCPRNPAKKALQKERRK